MAIPPKPHASVEAEDTTGMAGEEGRKIGKNVERAGKPALSVFLD
jgi:hypothetical protein